MMNLDSLKITPEILALIASIDEFKGAWRALGTLAPDRLYALRKVAVNWQPWILFFLRALSQQTRLLSQKIERERLAMVSLPESALRILEHAKEHGRVSIGDMVTLTGVSRNTLKSHFRRLVADGHLILHGEKRGAWYTLGKG